MFEATSRANGGAGKFHLESDFLKFTKTRHNRVFEEVIQQVEEAIISGDLKPGDRLPSERELRAMFDVGRGTLRESLRVLEQKGLIEIKTGSKGGIYVRKVTSDPMSDNLALLLRSKKVSLRHLAQFREDVEGLVAARAAAESGRADLGELRGLLIRLDDAAEQGVEEWSAIMEADRNIHLALADLAGNPIHHYFLEVVHENVHRYNIEHFLARNPETIETLRRDLRMLVEAVLEGNAEQAETIARGHVRSFNELMEEAAKSSANRIGPLGDRLD